MAAKVRISLIESTCQKKGCKNQFSGPVHRHHKGNEKKYLRRLKNLFLVLRSEEKKFLARLDAHYHAFRERDIVRLCADHHEEIHEVYLKRRSEIVHKLFDERRRKKSSLCREMLFQIRMYRKICDEWLNKPS